MAKEADLVREIKSVMEREYHATAHKHHGGPYSERGVSDIFGTLLGGRAYYIEVKLPGELRTLTEWQERWLRHEGDHGAVAFVTSSVPDLHTILAACGIKRWKPTEPQTA